MARPYKSLCLAAVALALVTAATRTSADDTQRVIAVLDPASDEFDGAAFSQTLGAYLSPIGIESTAVALPTAPVDHDAWIELAAAESARLLALAVIWIEPSGPDNEAMNVYLMLLERESGAVVVMPIELGLRRGPAVFRALAATARMLIETEVLALLREANEVAKAPSTPDPWPPIEPSPPPPSPSAPPEVVPPASERTVELSARYSGMLTGAHAAIHNGAGLGLRLHLTGRLAMDVEAAYLVGLSSRAADIELRAQRAPIALGLSAVAKVSALELSVGIGWFAEAVWVTARGVGDAAGERIDPTARMDTGGEARLGVVLPIRDRLGAMLSGGLQLLAVSHEYFRGGEEVVGSSLVRFSWGLGIVWRGL